MFFLLQVMGDRLREMVPSSHLRITRMNHGSSAGSSRKAGSYDLQLCKIVSKGFKGIIGSKWRFPKLGAAPNQNWTILG